MKRIPLTQGQYTIIDDQDADLIGRYSWCAHWQRPKFYAVTNLKSGMAQKTLSMHRLILGLRPGDKRQGDHISGNTLDNRRANLRIATHAQNRVNRGLDSRNTSGFRGVSWFSRGNGKGYWRTQLRGKSTGYFKTKEEAAEAYQKAARKAYGPFAPL